MIKQILIIIIILIILFGTYWIAKHGSYLIWYEDLVKQTIQEMVKEEALK